MRFKRFFSTCMLGLALLSSGSLISLKINDEIIENTTKKYGKENNDYVVKNDNYVDFFYEGYEVIDNSYDNVYNRPNNQFLVEDSNKFFIVNENFTSFYEIDLSIYGNGSEIYNYVETNPDNENYIFNIDGTDEYLFFDKSGIFIGQINLKKELDNAGIDFDSFLMVDFNGDDLLISINYSGVTTFVLMTFQSTDFVSCYKYNKIHDHNSKFDFILEQDDILYVREISNKCYKIFTKNKGFIELDDDYYDDQYEISYSDKDYELYFDSESNINFILSYDEKVIKPIIGEKVVGSDYYINFPDDIRISEIFSYNNGILTAISRVDSSYYITLFDLHINNYGENYRFILNDNWELINNYYTWNKDLIFYSQSSNVFLIYSYNQITNEFNLVKVYSKDNLNCEIVAWNNNLIILDSIIFNSTHRNARFKIQLDNEESYDEEDVNFQIIDNEIVIEYKPKKSNIFLTEFKNIEKIFVNGTIYTNINKNSYIEINLNNVENDVKVELDNGKIIDFKIIGENTKYNENAYNIVFTTLLSLIILLLIITIIIQLYRSKNKSK